MVVFIWVTHITSLIVSPSHPEFLLSGRGRSGAETGRVAPGAAAVRPAAYREGTTSPSGGRTWPSVFVWSLPSVRRLARLPETEQEQAHRARLESGRKVARNHAVIFTRK